MELQFPLSLYRQPFYPWCPSQDLFLLLWYWRARKKRQRESLKLIRPFDSSHNKYGHGYHLYSLVVNSLPKKSVILKKGISASTLPCFYPQIMKHFKSKSINSGINSISVSQPQGYYCVFLFHATRKYSAIKEIHGNVQLVKTIT